MTAMMRRMDWGAKAMARLAIRARWGGRQRTVLYWLVIFLLGSGLGSYTMSASTPELSSAHAVHCLGTEEAAQRLPVHLRGVVTYYDSYADRRRDFIFLHDASGDIFISVAKGSRLPLDQGTRIEVRGVTEPGEFAPIVSHAQVRVLRRDRAIPAVELVHLPKMMLGSYDARFAEVEGVVQAVSTLPQAVVLTIATSDGVVRATTLPESSFDYTRLIDAQVRVRANIGPEFNALRQVTGVHLYFQSSADVTVLKEPQSDPFAGAPRPLNRLIRMETGLQMLRRVHVRGRVTLHWPGRLLCLQDGTGAVCARTAQSDPVEPGDLADVAGFPAVDDGRVELMEAGYRKLETAQPIAPAVLAAQRASSVEHAGELVTVEGRLLDVYSDSSVGPKDPVLTVDANGTMLQVVIPGYLRMQDWHAAERGSLLRFTGVCQPKMGAQRGEVDEHTSEFDTLRLLLRTPADVVFIASAPWWTERHVRQSILTTGIVGMLGCAWVIVLRRRVAQQTQTIRQSEGRFRYLAEHDGLTGLANRRLLHERLEAAMADAKARGSTLAVLMLDLDKFKRVNDSFGHPTGDAMLCAAAERITRSVREGDTVARMGGDEFVVLLPVLHDLKEATAAAARIVEAIAEPLVFEGRSVPMSASVGVCLYPEGGSTPDTLLGNCDCALYEAKEQGRNCWQAYSVRRMGPTAQAAPC